MKRIILGLSLLLMLVQNGFADTDAEFDFNIKRTTGYIQQNIKCEKMAGNHLETSNAKECVKAVKMLEQLSDSNPDKLEYLDSIAHNAGQLFYFSENNKIKAYEYWYKAAKLGHKTASKNLSIMCKQDPWACK